MQPDLRKQPIDDVLRRVEQRLDVKLDLATLVGKRRTVGARSDRETWIRVERRPITRLTEHGQLGDGIEASALLDGVARPRWYAAVSWIDESSEAVWRADEVEFVDGEPIRQGASLNRALDLSPKWWKTFNESLDVLAQHRTTRIATPDTQLLTQELVTETIERAFPGRVDTSLDGLEWVPAHADVNWSNVLGPECVIIDWEDFGLAPRGLDAATLWVSSLHVPAVAELVRRERWLDLESRSGRLMALFHCVKALDGPRGLDDPHLTPWKAAADEMIASLA